MFLRTKHSIQTQAIGRARHAFYAAKDKLKEDRAKWLHAMPSQIDEAYFAITPKRG